jgi:hypothetical protein
VYEALAAGVPTLISAIPELVSQFPNLPAHASGEELRANVDRVLEDPDYAGRLIESSRRQVDRADVRRHDALFQDRLGALLGRPGA